MKIGSTDITAAYLGSTSLQKVYVGSTEIWSSFTGLLDTYTGAAAAYSLRLLRAGYTGYAIKVRRASDNTEQDIGFSNNELDTTSLASFCSGTNGFVTTWYDQSGNGNNATQTTAANQPQIVSSGSVIIEGSKPTLQFNGTSNFLQASDSNSLSFTNGSGTDLPISAFATFKLTSSTSNRILFGKDSGSPNREYAWGYFSEAESRFFLKNNGGNDQISRDNKNAGQLNLYQQSTVIYDASEVNSGISFYSNGSAATMGDAVAGTYTGMANTTSPFTIGNYLSVNAYFEGTVEELILYPSDQSSNRTGIETNINGFYSIY